MANYDETNLHTVPLALPGEDGYNEDITRTSDGRAILHIVFSSAFWSLTRLRALATARNLTITQNKIDRTTGRRIVRAQPKRWSADHWMNSLRKGA